LVDGHAHGMK